MALAADAVCSWNEVLELKMTSGFPPHTNLCSSQNNLLCKWQHEK
jgi:hypothetical protein